MTTYITIQTKKRNFTFPVQMPELSTTAMTLINGPDTRITRAGDTRITRAGDTRVSRNVTTGVYPRLLKTRKRNFTIVAKVKNG